MSASTGRTPLASRLFAAGSGSTIRNDLTPRWEAGRRWRPCKQRWWELHLAQAGHPDEVIEHIPQCLWDVVLPCQGSGERWEKRRLAGWPRCAVRGQEV